MRSIPRFMNVLFMTDAIFDGFDLSRELGQDLRIGGCVGRRDVGVWIYAFTGVLGEGGGRGELFVFVQRLWNVNFTGIYACVIYCL